MDMKKIIILIATLHFYCKPAQPFKLGVELFHTEYKNYISEGNSVVALITNQTGIDQQGRKTKDILASLGIRVGIILVPEHGLHGAIAAGKKTIESNKEQGVPVISLYAYATHEKQIILALKQVDMLIFDIQDSGMRHYTYIATLLKALHLAARVNKKIIVLDRPNPLGVRMEGPLTESSVFSEIAALPIPLRHSMTMGEIALYCNKYVLKHPVDLQVVFMQGYHRKRGISQQLPIQLSPNIQTLQACFGYSFLGLLGEVQPFDVGIGTPYSFQRIGLPSDLNISPGAWERLAQCLAKSHIKSQIVSYFNERKKKQYEGVLITIADINAVSSFMVLMNILSFFKREGIGLSFSRAFDKAIGTKQVRKYIAGLYDQQSMAKTINEQLHAFYKKAQSVLHYTPSPQVTLVR